VDRRTVEVYEQVAAEYAARRQPRAASEAQRFARRVRRRGLRIDLGCGPARYTADLGTPIVALDASAAMLALVPGRAGHALRVRADLEALPFRMQALAGAWANLSYQHIPRVRLPLALAGLQRSLEVGAALEAALFPGTGEGPWPGDEFPGRLFARWEPHELRNILTGAGFGVRSIRPDADQLRVRAVRERTLPDIVGPGLDVLVCGLNPSVYAADAGVGFARPGNRFWPAALAAGLVTADRDPWDALTRHGVGFTDIVKRATPSAGSLERAEYAAGLRRVSWLVEWLAPRVVCFVGLAGWRAAVDRRAQPGEQPCSFAGARAYVMPSTSGLNASSSLASLTDHLRAVRQIARG
jgi:double-stranded uracil-DNA glycosylase